MGKEILASKHILGRKKEEDRKTIYWKQLENKQEMKASRFMKWNNCIN
jgi:hypothetical protein